MLPLRLANWLFIATFLYSSAYFFALDNKVFAIYPLMMIFAMQLPWLFYYGFRWTQKIFKKEFNYFFEFLFGVVMAMNALGGLKYHGENYEFDSFEHFIIPILGTIIFSLLWYGYLHCFRRPSLTTSLIYGIFTVIFWAVLWELTEMYVDQKYGVLLFNPSHKPWDVYTDFFWNVVGMAIGSLVYLRIGDRLFDYFKKGLIEKIIKK